VQGTLRAEFKRRRSLRRFSSRKTHKRHGGEVSFEVQRDMGYANDAFISGDSDTAVRLLEGVVTRVPSYAPAWALLAQVHKRLRGDNPRAIAALVTAAHASRKADSAPYWRQLASLYAAEGQVPEAADAMAKVTRHLRLEIGRVATAIAGELAVAAVPALAQLLEPLLLLGQRLQRLELRRRRRGCPRPQR
jgi:tetratricopeptide (TPR) repeat protein